MDIDITPLSPIILWALSQIALLLIRGKKMPNFLRDLFDQKEQTAPVNATPYTNGNGTAQRAQQTSIELIVDKLNNLEALFKGDIARVERETDQKMIQYRMDMERYAQTIGETTSIKAQELFTELKSSIDNLAAQIKQMNEAA